MLATPRFPLIQTPTPLHRLGRLSNELGVDLWIKRDDLTGFAGGGNKGRKLEYLLADALRSGADTVVTCGALQSNFIRQLGAACAVAGLKCAAAAMALPYLERPVQEPALRATGGNVLLDEIFGVDLRIYPDGDWDDLYARSEVLALECEAKGARVYRIPVGGSSPLGAYSFYIAAQELAAQSEEPFDAIVFASSSGSTQVGLAYAYAGTTTQPIGIACDPEPDIAEDFAEIGLGLARLLHVNPMPASAFRLDFRAVGPGYAAWSPETNRAIVKMARSEGILLDPVYSGKAFEALLSMAADRALSGRVLFWHTGGVPGLFAATGPL